MTFKELMQGNEYNFMVKRGFTIGPRGKKKYFLIERRPKSNTFVVRDEVGNMRYVSPKDIIRQ